MPIMSAKEATLEPTGSVRKLGSDEGSTRIELPPGHTYDVTVANLSPKEATYSIAWGGHTEEHTLAPASGESTSVEGGTTVTVTNLSEKASFQVSVRPVTK